MHPHRGELPSRRCGGAVRSCEHGCRLHAALGVEAAAAAAGSERSPAAEEARVGANGRHPRLGGQCYGCGMRAAALGMVVVVVMMPVVKLDGAS